MIIMIDTETTSLDPSIGCAHQLAFLTNSGLGLEVDLPTTEYMWDSKTLAWAERNGTAPAIHPDSSLTAVEAARKAKVEQFTNALLDLKKQSREVSLVFRHPEFDIPFLEKEGVQIRAIFGHRNVYDLCSLIRGYYAGRYHEAGSATIQRMVDGHYAMTGPSPHRALDDCRLQMELLAKANYGGLF